MKCIFCIDSNKKLRFAVGYIICNSCGSCYSYSLYDNLYELHLYNSKFLIKVNSNCDKIFIYDKIYNKNCFELKLLFSKNISSNITIEDLNKFYSNYKNLI